MGTVGIVLGLTACGERSQTFIENQYSCTYKSVPARDTSAFSLGDRLASIYGGNIYDVGINDAKLDLEQKTSKFFVEKVVVLNNLNDDVELLPKGTTIVLPKKCEVASSPQG
jgi:hypothetical protein